MPSLASLLTEVRACVLCAEHLPLGPRPVVQVHPFARILIAGQAPGRKVHETGVPFNDASGDRPALQPEVKMVDGETWSEGQDVVVEMHYETLPTIPDLDASSVVLERLMVSADPESVSEALANLAGVPALTLPAGWSDDGLPVGVQIMGRPNSEATLLALAARLDDSLAAYRPPLGFD